MYNKYFFILSILITFSLFLVVNGCDSVTDSKPISITTPVPVSPADQSTGISLTPTFTWSESADKLEIATNSTFGNVVHSEDVTGNQCTIPAGKLQPSTKYFWHVGIYGNNTENWSTLIFSFTTGN